MTLHDKVCWRWDRVLDKEPDEFLYVKDVKEALKELKKTMILNCKDGTRELFILDENKNKQVERFEYILKEIFGEELIK